MSVVSRENVAAPVLPKETVDVPPLGGEVVVRGLRLSERLAISGRLAASGDGERLHALVSQLLAPTVVDAAGLPIYTVEQWEDFGATHQAHALALFNVALRLSGFGLEEAAKN